MMELYPSRKYNLIQLQKWLDYEIPAATLFLLSWLFGFLLLLVLLAAIIFTPFMLKVLYEEKKFGWIISFLILVIIPLIIILLVDLSFPTKILLSYIPLALFLFYCFVLKMSVRDWTADREFLRRSLDDDPTPE